MVPKLAAIVISNDPENPGAVAEEAKAMLLAMAAPRDESTPKPAKPKPRSQHRRDAAETKAKEAKIH